MLFLLSLVLFTGLASAQSGTLTGYVMSQADNEPLIGATVRVKGTQLAASTNIDGQFTINNVPATAKTLIVSYVGMVTREVGITPGMTVFLTDNAANLDEIVVTAYGTSKKSSLTGAISQVKADKLESRPVSNVAQALEGNVTGVQVNVTDGQPGSSPTIRIRGIGTVTGSADPLWVIDGVPMDGNVTDLNPTDIESMSVLKDAASCALYGSRAANGVILVTTKSGNKDGRLSLTLRMNQGWYTRGIKEYKTVNPYQFMEAQWQNMYNGAISGNKSPEEAAAYATENIIPNNLYLNIFNKADDALFDVNGRLYEDVMVNPLYADDLDWFDQGSRKGYRQEYTLGGQMGNERGNAYFSLGYLDENGYTKDARFQRINGRLSMNLQATDWFKVGLNMSGSHQKSSFTYDEDGKYASIFTVARSMAPIYPVHLHNPATGEYVLDAFGQRQYDTGVYNYVDEYGNPQSISTRNYAPNRHVIMENELNQDRSVRNTLQGIAYAEVKFLKDFTFNVKGNLNIRHNDNRDMDNSTIGDGAGNNGRIYSTRYRYKSYSFHETLQYRHTFADVHFVEALVGHENYKYNYDYEYGKKSDEVFPGKNFLTNYTSLDGLTGYQNNYRTESWLARVRYGYDNRYNLEASFRRDGTSRLKKKWGNFGSVGANWVISNEQFMKELPWLQNLVLRANWGQVGQDAGVGYYGYMALYTADINAQKGAYYLSQLENPDLKWETADSWDIGIDARLFNRWNVTLEYFDKRNKDLLFDVHNPISAGTTYTSYNESVVTRNIGTISNRGLEFSTDIDVYTSRDWTVNFNANLTWLKNKVTKMPEENKDGLIDGSKKIMVGKSRYEYWLRDWVGVDQMTGRSLYVPDFEQYYIAEEGEDGEMHLMAGEDSAESQLTDYVEINGQYYTNNPTYSRRRFFGSSLPKVYGSFGLRVAWKSLSLSTLFTYALGGKVLDGVYQSLMSASETPSNFHQDIMQSWNGIPEGMTEDSPARIDPNGTPAINFSNSAQDNIQSSRFLISGNYLVCKNININWSLPKLWMRPLGGISGIDVFATIDNLFSCTKRRGMSPQQSMDGTQVDRTVVPRVYSFGLQVKF